MSNLVLAGLPVFGMLACLFIGFHFVTVSRSHSAERIGYFFFAGAVAWVITTGAILWPQLHNFEPTASLPGRHAPSGTTT